MLSVVDLSTVPASRCLFSSSSSTGRDSASVGKGTSYIMDNAAAKLKKKRMTKFEVSELHASGVRCSFPTQRVNPTAVCCVF